MASDLGRHCLPMSHKKDARLIWVKIAVHACLTLVTPKYVTWQTVKTQLKCRIMFKMVDKNFLQLNKTSERKIVNIFLPISFNICFGPSHCVPTTYVWDEK